MLVNRIKTLMCGALMAAPVMGFAHPGHDHSHWMSSSIHIFLALSIVGVVGVAVAMYFKRKKSTSNEKV